MMIFRWIDTNSDKLWDIPPSCSGPGELSGALLKNLGFNNLCDGQWASMMHLSPRIPIKNKPNEESEKNSTENNKN